MFGDNSIDQSSEATAQVTGRSLLEPVKVLGELDTKFNDLYNNIVGNLNTFNLYSSKLQSIEIQELSKQLNSKKEEYDYLGKKTETDETEEQILDLLNAGSNNILGNIGDMSISVERKKRYQFYEEIPNVNYIAYRMLKVYLDNILIKNVQTKQFLNINNNQNNIGFLQTVSKDIGKQYTNFIKTFIVYFDMQKKLKNRIIPEMLKYGNSFVEILDVGQVAEVASKKIELLTESFTINKQTSNLGFCLFESNLPNAPVEGLLESELPNIAESSLASLLKEQQRYKLLEESNVNFFNDVVEKGDEFKFEEINNLDFGCLKNIILKNVNPNQVIIIESDGILYGYIIVDELEEKEGTEIDIFKRFTQQESSKSGNENDARKEVIENMTRGIMRKINDTIKATGITNIEELGLSETVESNIKVILYHKIKERAKLKFRFVMPNRLINYSTNIDKFGPYGTSIFDPIIQPVKMYTLALMSSIVSRLSRASVVRKWTIEAGNRKNHSEIIESVKKDIANKSISFDTLSDVRNISRVVTDFRDLATIQINGQRFVDMEVMPMHDRSLPLNDMDSLRNELIAATGIPSVYLNIGDQVDLRETLVNLNTSFANTISSYQGNIDDSDCQLLDAVFDIVLDYNNKSSESFRLSNFYNISLNPPLVLTVQANEALISSVSNIIGLLKGSDIVIDPIEIMKLYIPQLNWDDLAKSGTAYIKKEAKQTLMTPQDPNAMGQ